MTPTAPAPAETARAPAHPPSTLGVRRFFHENETLIKMGSLVFAAAGFLRAQPKDDAVAILQCLLIVVGLVIFGRLWADLPRRYGVLPGEHWTVGLIVVYYCLAISLVVGTAYLTAGFVTQRDRYLWIALGSLLTVAGGTALTYRSSAERGVAGALERVLGRGQHTRLAGALIAGLLIVTILGSYLLARAISPALNDALDQISGIPRR